ncbi:MAG: zinc-binding alcohol dehydrogenase family protein [Amylibacter sp.]
MRAYGFTEEITAPNAEYLLEIEKDEPQVGPRDLLVKIASVAINPVDVKVRGRVSPETGQPKILGYDAAGVVEAVGPDVTLFKLGDAVFYAGDITRDGSFADKQLVDERIVGPKPKSLSFGQAAAMPLTSITAWEILFERLAIKRDGSAKGVLLVVGGAGGVGSILIQLAKTLTDLTIIATASRDKTIAWCKDLGAHHVINHREPLAAQIAALDVGSVNYTAALTHTDKHFAQIIEAAAVDGKICLIDDPVSLDVIPMKGKCLSLHWEMMFARSMHQTTDMIGQHNLLAEVSSMLDMGNLRVTGTRHMGAITLENLIAAMEYQATGEAVGKTVLGEE